MTTPVTVEQARKDAVTCLDDIRRDANAIEDKAKAIDYAIHGTLSIVATAVETVDEKPHAVLHELSKQLEENWAAAEQAQA